MGVHSTVPFQSLCEHTLLGGEGSLRILNTLGCCRLEMVMTSTVLPLNIFLHSSKPHPCSRVAFLPRPNSFEIKICSSRQSIRFSVERVAYSLVKLWLLHMTVRGQAQLKTGWILKLLSLFLRTQDPWVPGPKSRGSRYVIRVHLLLGSVTQTGLQVLPCDC